MPQWLIPAGLQSIFWPTCKKLLREATNYVLAPAPLFSQALRVVFSQTFLPTGDSGNYQVGNKVFGPSYKMTAMQIPATLYFSILFSGSEFELFSLFLEATFSCSIANRINDVLSINLFTTQFFYCTLYECHCGIFPGLCLHFSTVPEMDKWWRKKDCKGFLLSCVTNRKERAQPQGGN